MASSVKTIRSLGYDVSAAVVRMSFVMEKSCAEFLHPCLFIYSYFFSFSRIFASFYFFAFSPRMSFIHDEIFSQFSPARDNAGTECLRGCVCKASFGLHLRSVSGIAFAKRLWDCFCKASVGLCLQSIFGTASAMGLGNCIFNASP